MSGRTSDVHVTCLDWMVPLVTLTGRALLISVCSTAVFLSATLVRSVVRRQPSVVWSIEGFLKYSARVYQYNGPFVQ